MSEFGNICVAYDFEQDKVESHHEFLVVDWSYEPSGMSTHNISPHTKQARRLLCQRCFAIVDLGMIDQARTRLLNTE
jgi:hypothetical protein